MRRSKWQLTPERIERLRMHHLILKEHRETPTDFSECTDAFPTHEEIWRRHERVIAEEEARLHAPKRKRGRPRKEKTEKQISDELYAWQLFDEARFTAYRMKVRGHRPRGGCWGTALTEVAQRHGITVDALKKRIERDCPVKAVRGTGSWHGPALLAFKKK